MIMPMVPCWPRSLLPWLAAICLAICGSAAEALVYQPPDGTSMWDTWMFCEGEDAHLFYLRSEVGGRWNSIGHAVSRDLVHWKELPPIPTKGPAGAWDHALTLTGCTVKRGDTYYLFYGAANRSQQVGVMTSTNLVDWRAWDGNPVSESDGPLYGDGYDWRDLSAFYDAVEGRWRAVICARAGRDHTAANPCPTERADAKHGQPAIGHLVSSDLIHWEPQPPLFTSWRWGNLEVPEAFALGGRHYLLFSHGGSLPETSGRTRAGGTFYLQADTSAGPYRVPDEPLLLGWGHDRLDNYVGRVVRHRGELLLYHHTCGGPVKDDPRNAWQPGVGGPVTLGAPKRVQQRADGTLRLSYWPGLDAMEQRVVFDGPPPDRKNGGVCGLPVRGDDLSLRTTFHVGGEDARVGAIWRWDGRRGGAAWLRSGKEGVTVEIGEVTATDEAVPTWRPDDDIRCGPLADGDHELRVLVRGHRAEVYLDDRWLFATPTTPGRSSDGVGVFASGGGGVRHVRVAELSPLRPTVSATAAGATAVAVRIAPTDSQVPPTAAADESLLRELAPPEFPALGRTEPALHGLFTDGMVLQRDAAVPVWGFGPDGAEVTVSFGDARVATRVSGGRWSVTLPPMAASATGRDLVVTSGTHSIVRGDVLVGDVWLCSGQSNMSIEMKIDVAHPPRAADLEAAGNPLVRFFKVDRASSRVPRLDIPEVRDDVYEPWFNAFLGNRWRPCTTEWAQHVSATAFYFARELQPRIGCPLGIIIAARGGSDIGCWVPGKVIEAESSWSDLRHRLAAAESNWPAFVAPLIDQWRAFTSRYPTLHDLWLAQQNSDQPPPRQPAQPAWPSCFYNGMIHPLAPFAVKGVLWYQGEADVGNAAAYADRLVGLVRSWRELWRRPDLPFVVAEIAPFEYPPPEGRAAALRAAQARVPSLIPAVHTASLIDAGMRKNIHPLQKDVAGRRLALVARKEIYGEPITASGPQVRSITKTGRELAVSFDHADGRLVAREIDLDGTVVPGGTPRGFTIRGGDGAWQEASARIEADRVVVSSPSVPDPVAVRYAWADFPLANLCGGSGLPASPFEREIALASRSAGGDSGGSAAPKVGRTAYLYEPTPGLGMPGAPNDGLCADVIPFFWKGKFHIMHLQLKPGQKGWDWAQLVTPDFVAIDHQGVAIPGTRTDDAIDRDIFTGSVIEKDGVLHAFYCGHNDALAKEKKPDQVMLHATSTDGITWTKDEGFLLSPEGDARYRWPGAFRDGFVFWNPEKNEYGMIVTATPVDAPTGGLAYARSADLKTWTLGDPFPASGRFAGYECPDLFRWGDHWYLVFSTYWRNPGWTTRYMMAPRLEGPWTSPADDFFDGGTLYAAKSVSDGTRRYLCGTLPRRDPDPQGISTDDGTNGWSGRILIHELHRRPDGTLGTRIPPQVKESFGPPAAVKLPDHPWWGRTAGGGVRAAQGPVAFQLGTLPPRCLLRAELTLPAAGRAGFWVGGTQEGKEGFRIFVDVGARLLVWDRNERPLGANPERERNWRPLAIKPGDKVTLEVLLDGNAAVACVDDDVCLSTRIYDRRDNTFGIWSDTVGSGFENVTLRAADPAR